MNQEEYTLEQIQGIINEHIIRGDRSDGIPNVFMADNAFVDKIRQKPITSKILQAMLEDTEQYCIDNDIIANYKRNQMLIDFSYIPQHIASAIIAQYEKIKKPSIYSYVKRKHKS